MRAIGPLIGAGLSLFPGGQNSRIRASRITAREISEAFGACLACGSVLELREGVNRETGELGAIKLHAANFCRKPAICELCAGRVGDRRQSRFAEAIKGAAEGLIPYMVTFTIPSGPTLRGRLAALKMALRRFQRMGQKGREGEWSKVAGGLSKIEIKRGRGSGGWHPHCHALLFTVKPLDYALRERITFRGREVRASKISREWNRATRGEAMGIRVDPIGKKPDHKMQGLSLGESVFLQSREVLKYITKFEPGQYDSDSKMAADFVEVMDATYCRRLFSTYGIFRSVPGSDFR